MIRSRNTCKAACNLLQVLAAEQMPKHIMWNLPAQRGILATMELWIIAIIAGIAGAVGGALVTYLIVDAKARAYIAAAETARAVAEQKAVSLDAALQQSAGTLQAEQSTTTALRAKLSEVEKQHAGLGAQLAASRQNIDEQRQLLDEANTRLTAAFATVSQEALARSNEAFLQMAETRFKTLSTDAAGTLDERKAQIATLLKPLEEMLGNYQKRLAEIESSRTNAYGELLKHIGSMAVTQQTLSTQTSQLVSALKKSTVRGRWGEIALQRLAEMAGMTEHVDFMLQESFRNDEGRLLRPDMTVYLPGNRCVVVDSKAVMNAFLDAMGVTDDAARAALMQTHARNVRTRVDDLSSKAYWSQFAAAPEFVVLFLPGESFLYAACESDPDLIQYAISQRVLLATPTTFIGLLQTIEYGWRQQSISDNANQIRTLGIEIFDRLATFAGNMVDLGNSLDKAVENYNKSIGSIESRLLVSARKMSELGAHSDRELPELPLVDKRPRELAPTLFPDSIIPLRK